MSDVKVIGTFEMSDDFESSNIKSPIMYNEEAKTMMVTFRSGAIYTYSGVERDIFDKLNVEIQASRTDPEKYSVGKAFNELVKKGGYEYQKVEVGIDWATGEEPKVPTYSGVEVGMLWFDNDPEAPLEKKIGKAVRYYQKKYNLPQEHQLEVLVSEADFPQDVLPEQDYMIETNATSIMVVMDRYVRKDFFLVSVAHV